MHIPRNQRAPTMYFDCDGTLVLWPDDFKDSFQNDLAIAFHFQDSVYNLVPNPDVIEALKSKAKAGYTIVVWSLGGAEWAEIVVKTLGIQDHVEFCLSKPDKFWDDEKASSFMGEWARKIPGNPYE